MLLKLPRQRQLDLSRPVVMGILNITPDSFSDGGQHNTVDAALYQAEQMLADGATVLDIGGESTRPGAAAVPLQQELDRVVPVIAAIRQRFDCVLSVDTSKAGVMSAAVQAGADMINDVQALQGEGALACAAELNVPVCIMHMQGEPRTMQQQPRYDDVVAEVIKFLQRRTMDCQFAGIGKSQIILDPGFGFGKTLSHNYQLLAALEQLVQLGYPVLAGMSRKSMVGQLLNVPLNQRLAGSVACATIAALQGARIIRVHDVKETVHALQVATAVRHGVEA
ncbi:dihydropteroate synthase [Arsukibacterium indicum]|uniref:Dihydropteroate synthase n=1 Tax=Arsukibacterium indicum TaxID=2848612 RepID=A0ABS6ML49_9GAMM|nr:dihydropteroate synthase [Arsukibacterium indicum]MBV2129524.1 dihydropteroate synthase [Arsukibacterium indicum]